MQDLHLLSAQTKQICGVELCIPIIFEFQSHRQTPGIIKAVEFKHQMCMEIIGSIAPNHNTPINHTFPFLPSTEARHICIDIAIPARTFQATPVPPLPIELYGAGKYWPTILAETREVYMR